DWPEAWRKAVGEAFAALQKHTDGETPTGTINLKLVDDAEIAGLNQHSTGENHATDVLTFNYQENQDATYGELADIVISTETAERQAAVSGTRIEEEVALLAVHGILHVLGYDHAQASDRDKLDQLQAAIMDSAGLAYRDFQWVN
ncbi:MAG TPA: rRNA maturation RNase YbeY, partial [Candidatus Polarisedimenticolaceae bacterium]|nr:rRNA maturation RNase YbeY [Candidatus Polarisedimenticolaceae bacterium]